MLLHRHLAVLMAALVLLLVPGCKDRQEEAAISALYASWSEAGSRKDANGFLARIDPGSIARFDTIARLALKGTRKELKALESSELDSVIAIRNRMSRDEIAALDGEKALRWLVEAGEWADESQAEPAEEHLDNFQIGDRRAMADLHVEGFRDQWRISFVKGEDGKWRLELDALVAVQSRWTDKMLAKFRVPPEEAALEYEADRSGKTPRKDILDVPPKD